MSHLFLLAVAVLAALEGLNGWALPSRLSSGRFASSSLTQQRVGPLQASAAISLTSDDGVRKVTIIEGKGKTIEAGDILAVEYTCSVKGSETPFATNPQEKIIAIDGSMIKAWDLGLATMSVGEKATFTSSAAYAYGEKGIGGIIPPNSDIVLDMKVLAWLGNQLRPESLFQKDLDIDPFIASTPETIRAEYEEMQAAKSDKYDGNILQIYWRRLRNISFGFGGSGFFTSQSGEKAPWYLNPNLTFPAMIALTIVTFGTVFLTGSVKEKGMPKSDLEVSQIQRVDPSGSSSNDVEKFFS